MRLALFAVALSLATAPTHAGHRPTADYARVIDVDPIYETIAREIPRQECWQESVPAHRSATGPILGAIIGGALGNELGHHKSNKQVGAVVGAVLGASIGNDISRRHGRSGYRTEEYCRDATDIVYEKEVTGYWVTYQYQGRRYETRMPYHPGKRLPVNVAVEPRY